MILTQTKWPPQLSMPAGEPSLSPSSPILRSTAVMLKRHKILPHPPDRESAPHMLGYLPPTPPAHSRHSSSGNSSEATGDSIFLRHRYRVSDGDTRTSHSISIPTTPLNDRPPTPDFTPPRLSKRPTYLRPPTSERYPSSRAESFKTARESPFSSHDDVNTTIRLGRRSEHDTPQIQLRRNQWALGLGLGLESEGSATPRVLTPKPKLEAFDGEWVTPTADASEVEREWDDNLMRNVTVRKRRHVDRPQRDVLEDGRIPDSPTIPGQDIHEQQGKDEAFDNVQVMPTNAAKLVREVPLRAPGQQQVLPDNISRRIVSAPVERAARASLDAELKSPATPDVRRFSAMSSRSANSTVIEALVVNTYPLRPNTLRHRKKLFELRDIVSERSAQGSAAGFNESHDLRRRFNEKTWRVPTRGQRLSSGTTGATSTTSSAQSRNEVWKSGGIPVVVVPERLSSRSIKPPSLRSTSSRRTQKSVSLGSRPTSQPPQRNTPASFGLPSQERQRPFSDYLTSEDTSQRTIDYPPVVPARRSSLSAPTSKSNSRTGSLTAESLKAHDLQQVALASNLAPRLETSQKQTPDERELRFQPRPSIGHNGNNLSVNPVPGQSEPSVDSRRETRPSSRPMFDQNGDPFFGNRLSVQQTPFSQVSYETNATAMTAAELLEARTVTMYPHQNKSLLVVQHQPVAQISQPTLTANDDTSASATAVEAGPATPPLQLVRTMEDIDSPLRNPRAPPQPPLPPAIKFIPPTPSTVVTPRQELDRQLIPDAASGHSQNGAKPKRSLSLVRRALSSRRNSESIISRTFSLGRRDSASRPSTASKTPTDRQSLGPPTFDLPSDETKLHPFWRPGSFWEDLEYDETEEGHEDWGARSWPRIDNRPAPPKRSLSSTLKRTFAIMPLQPLEPDEYRYSYAPDRFVMRRTDSGTLKVAPRTSTDSGGYVRPDPERSTGRVGLQWSYEIQERGDGHAQTKARVVPGLARKIEYVGFRGLQRRLSERKREKRTEQLRKTISQPRDAVIGVDQVLRGYEANRM